MAALTLNLPCDTLAGLRARATQTSPPTQTVFATKQVADLAGVHRSHAKAWLTCFSCIFLVLESCLSRAAGGQRRHLFILTRSAGGASQIGGSFTVGQTHSLNEPGKRKEYRGPEAAVAL